ncbi:hypothetical protein O9929_06575 [Vibrio lentus]|nr:hypothetical protein [Vibrio lentus]
MSSGRYPHSITIKASYPMDSLVSRGLLLKNLSSSRNISQLSEAFHARPTLPHYLCWLSRRTLIPNTTWFGCRLYVMAFNKK